MLFFLKLYKKAISLNNKSFVNRHLERLQNIAIHQQITIEPPIDELSLNDLALDDKKCTKLPEILPYTPINETLQFKSLNCLNTTTQSLPDINQSLADIDHSVNDEMILNEKKKAQGELNSKVEKKYILKPRFKQIMDF